MKRLTAVCLILVLTLTACAQAQARDLMADVTARPVEGTPDMDAGAAAAADFGVRLLQASLEEEQNTLISPLSVLTALAMTANGAQGETLAQMEAVLGLDSQTLNGFLHAYMAALARDGNGGLRMANSIWFKEDPRLEVEQEFLQTNADYYQASIYKAAFDDQTLKDINAWVSEHTDKMIPAILDEIPEDAVLYLVNALAFDAEWEELYDANDLLEKTFTAYNGEKRTVEMMNSEEFLYLEDENATGFLKYYEGRDYAFAALLPNEGVSVQEYVRALTGEHLLELLSDPQEITVYAWLPKFETEFDVEMSDILEELGMTDAFDGSRADLSRMGTCDDGASNLYINRVLHKTFLSVSEQGTRAGAATVVEAVAECAVEIVDSRTVHLDRPFVYLLIDTQTNLPLFFGTVLDVSAG